MKNCNYYSLQEDQRFSNIVVEFNQMDARESKRESLKKVIFDRTQILIYELPIRNLFLNEDEAAEIYLCLRDDVERIVDSYRYIGKTYNSYITSICKFKARSLDKRNKAGMNIEDSYKSDLLYELEARDSIQFFEREPFYGTNRPEIYTMDMKALVEFISSSSDCNDFALDLAPREIRLAKSLEKRISRKHMMIYLMYLPQMENPYFIDSISRVMNLDPMVFSYFYALKFELCTKINEKWQKKQNTAARHFKTLLKLRAQIAYETDREKIRNLNNIYTKVYNYYILSLEKSKRLKRGLNQNEIAEHLGIRRSSVFYAIKQTKSILTDALAEIDCT